MKKILAFLFEINKVINVPLDLSVKLQHFRNMQWTLIKCAGEYLLHNHFCSYADDSYDV